MSKLGNKIAKQRARQFVHEYLSQRSCVDCGENDIGVLTFDHVSGYKTGNIADLVSDGHSIMKIASEIEKTDVVCFNCHMKREQARRGYGRFGRFDVA